VAQAIIAFMRDRDFVEEAASKLHAMIEAEVGEALNLKADKDWPKTSRTLWKKIRVVMPFLEARGIRASRGSSKKLGLPIMLSTDLGDDPDGPPAGPDSGGDKGGNNADLGEIMKVGGR
jgi:hypothetical protein